jgi:1,4-dihydroxy-6-naphthoate synthase
MQIRLGHSPDADDAFMFWALASGRVDRRGFEFEHVLRDIQTLNEWALEGRLETTAISLHAYPFVQDRYVLLPHGASMGAGYGPIVVAREPLALEDLADLEIAVPGRMTTAFLVLRMAIGDFRYREVPFDRILDEVREGRAEAGLVIHEGQLTYGGQGLVKLLDLGQWWKQETGLPLPLGGNAVRRDLGQELVARLTRLVRETVKHSLAHRAQALEYAMSFARGMDPGVADRFVGMWVNDMTVEMGERGRRAVQLFLDRGFEAGVIPRKVSVDFVEA